MLGGGTGRCSDGDPDGSALFRCVPQILDIPTGYNVFRSVPECSAAFRVVPVAPSSFLIIPKHSVGF